MKKLLIAINSQFVHINLAVRSLNASLTEKIDIFECNINTEITKVYADILEKRPDFVLFSCYIWNIDYVLKLAKDLKLANSNIKIALGGPEVSFDSEDILKKHDFLDYILIGEWEEKLEEFLQRVENGEKLTDITGVVSRDYQDFTYNIVEDINVLKPAKEIYDVLENDKIYYYETSRGCPYSCSYCLSGSIKDRTRYLDLDRVFDDLKYFSENDIPLVKFVDRTFNADKKRAKAIIDFASKNTGNTSFHFEVGADILDDEIIDMLNNSPHGKFQLEAGVQSCNEKTLEAVVRVTDLDKLSKNTKKIIDGNNVHLHLDLIAGLPYEDFKSFGNSINTLYKLNPHHLQLGFLKMLKGSKIREDALKYGIVYRDYAPYEVISTNDLTALEVLELKDIEEIIERYINSDLLRDSIDILIKECPTPFVFFKTLAENFRKKGYLSRPMSTANRVDAFLECYEEEFSYVEGFLRIALLDYLKNAGKGSLPKTFSKILLEIDNKPYRNMLFEKKLITGEQFKKAKFYLLEKNEQIEVILAYNGHIEIFIEDKI